METPATASGTTRRPGWRGPRRARTFSLAAHLAVIVACFVCYANALGNGFVAGDLQFIKDNPAIKDPSVLTSAFTRGYWWVGGRAEVGVYYRPLVVLLDAWDHLVWGDRPFGYHLTNLLLHAGASVVVLRLARAWLRSPAAALGAALLFAVHPIHVHAAGYVSARSAILCTGFYAGAVLAARRYRDVALAGRVRPRDLGIVLACYVGGLLSLESAITMPVAIAAAMALPREDRRSWLRRLVPLASSLALATAGYFVARRLAIGVVFSSKERLADHLGLVPTALTIAKTYAYYLAKLAVPTDVTYLPPFLPALRAGDAGGIAALAGLSALGLAILLGPPRWIRERAAAAWVLLTLVPVSGIFPLDHFVKGQYAYLPSVGSCILVAALARRALRRGARSPSRRAIVLAVSGAFGLLLVGYGGQTVLENTSWESQATLFARVIELEPQIPDELFAHPVMTPTANRFAAVHLDIAQDLVAERDCAAARAHFERAGRLTRRRTVKLTVRQLDARCLLTENAFDRALAAYLSLVEDAPADPVAPKWVAWLYLRQRDLHAALPYLHLACERGSEEACAEERWQRAGLPH